MPSAWSRANTVCADGTQKLTCWRLTPVPPLVPVGLPIQPAAGCEDPTTSQSPVPYPYGVPVAIPGSAGSVDYYPFVVP
jgi:hypothetical protein